MQNFRPVPLTVFEIQGLKPNNNNNKKKQKKKKKKKKNWRNGLFAICPILVVQFFLVRIGPLTWEIWQKVHFSNSSSSASSSSFCCCSVSNPVSQKP